MKEIYARISIVLLIVFVSSTVFAQRSNGLRIGGNITTEEGSPEGAIIQMYQDGKRADNYGVPRNGRYDVELNYNHKFELIFQREGNFQQKVVIETFVSKEVLASDPRFPPYPIDIKLFTEIPGIDKSFSENTVLKIFYSPSVDNFVHELYYNDAQIKKLIDQAILQGEVVDKNADYMSKLTRAELAELRKEYNKLLEQAGTEYSGEKFLAALDGYKAASKILPSEQFPKDRIAEINDLLGLIMAAEELDKAKLERFNALVKEGDLFFNQTRYSDAKMSYDRALSIKPFDQYVNDQLKKIADLLQRQLLEEKYKDLIAQGDKTIKELLYNEALGVFNEALKIRPNEQYPKAKIAEINGLLAAQQQDQEKQKSYADAMFEGEKQFTKQFYDRALTAFQKALDYRPNDIKATRRIEETQNIMKEILNKMSYDKFIAAADKAYKKKDYPEALTNYEEALALFPNEPRTKKRVEEISRILYTERSFAEFVTQADKQFEAKSYSNAKSLYEKALAINSGDKHVLAQIATINTIVAQQGVDEQYNNAISQADQLLANTDYNNAKGKYNEALGIKPKEKYPKDKIAEIDAALAAITKTNRDYQTALARADKLFQDKKYNDAKTAFLDAGNIKPEEIYPPEMIVKIDGLIAEEARLLAQQEADEKARLEAAAAAEAARLVALQAEKDKNYADAIARADNLFNEKNYENSRNEYRTALGVKPEEAYPQERIDEIGGILAQLSASAKAYEEAVALGDREFRREGWDAAIVAYNEAKQAKADEVYPDEQLAKIDSIRTERARIAEEAAAAEAARLAALQAEKDKNYADAIAKADNLFNEKNYENSRNEYRAALGVKPEEAYPQQRIDEIGGILAQLSASAKAYEEAVALGDREFRREGWDAAIVAYNEAKQAKADEVYPDEQLAKIDSIRTERARLAEEAAAAEAARLAAIQAEKDKNYADAIARADNLFNEKNYENSRNEYRAALGVKPEEAYPQQRIDEIGGILAQLSASAKAYEEAVARADREFRREGWDAAIVAYNEAKQAKADEVYPDEQLAKIDSIRTERARLAEEAAAAEAARLAAIQAEKDKNYTEAIARADNLFNEKEYENSRNEYRAALGVKPEEAYPQERIDEIGGILAQLSASAKAYEEAVALGDREFRREGWDAAIVAYNEAKQAKADEVYPDEQIARIDSIRTERARLAQEEADAEAARLAAIQAEKDKNYTEAIARADNLFNEKEYENSRNEYRAALGVKPEEAYPQQRIDEIGGILSQLSASAKAYEEAVALGDSEFRREGWDAAIVAYNEAKQAKADEVYPDEQLAEIDSIRTERARLAEEAAAAESARLAAIQAEKDKNYADAIARADNLFNEKEYENSRNEYRVALGVKSEEAYPQQRIDEIGTLLSQLAASQKAYDDAIRIGDNEFRKEGWDAAIVAYNEAKQAKADEVYPDEQLAKIDSIRNERARLAEEAAAAEAARLAAIQAEKDKNYTEAIARADNLFNEKEYENSRNEYRAALGVKPEEAYPQERIDEIGGILAQLSASAKAYEEAVALGDREFRREGWDAAIVAYNEAKQAKADEVYPDEQIARIDSIRTERARLAQEAADAEATRLATIQAEKDKNYADAVARADNLFNETNYENSRNEYRAALGVKPEEAYPQQRIDEIGTLLSQLAASQKAYDDAIRIGDNEFRKEGWDAAIVAYNNAKQAKVDEVYPDEQLAKIDSIRTERARLAEEAAAAESARLAAIQAEKDKNYADAIARADNLFNEKEYENSRNEYSAALGVKPEEAYPQQRIDEIGGILAQLSASAKAYEEAIRRADSEFRKEGWDAAIIAYNEAKQAKADEVYPDEQLAKIDSIRNERARLAEEAAAAESARLAAIQAEKDKNYADAIARADNLFNEKNYDNSRNEYETAQKIKPEEAYPPQRITEIDGILRELAAAASVQAELDRNYANLIQQADRFFNAKNYTTATDNYKKASDLKSDEAYPKDKLAEIEQTLQQQALNEKYRKIIVAADGLFRTQKYTDARLQYELALGVKSDEQYPRSQIMKIDDILNKEQQRILAEQNAAENLERRRGDIGKMKEELDEQKILAESGLNALYDQLIIKADAFFDDKQYNVSRAWYFKARDLKPEESYPPQRIAEINQILSGLMLSQRDREYQRFIDLGDTNFRDNELAVARGWYNQALGQKSDEQYPKDQLAIIQKRVAERVAGKSEQLFTNYKTSGNTAFEAGDFIIARFWYKKALELRPNDEEAKSRLLEITNKLK